MSTNTCELCLLPLPKNFFRDTMERAFCCAGCKAVYQILSTKEVKENFCDHPLFHKAAMADLISNPYFDKEAISKKKFSKILKLHFQIEDMWCSSCADLIQWILSKHQAVFRCVVDYSTDIALVEYDPLKISKENIFKEIEKLGYRAQNFSLSGNNKSLWIRFSLCTFCMLNLMMFSYPIYSKHFGLETEGYERVLGYFSCLLALPVVTFCAWPIWRRLIASFKAKIFGSESLVILGICSAFIYSVYQLLTNNPSQIYFDSLSMVLTFVLLGKILEKKAKFSLKESLFRVTRSMPKKGYKREVKGNFAYVPIKEIKIGDELLARTGEKIVLDGSVIKGEALVDESVMTGECLSIRKKIGDKLVGGSILRKGSVNYTVEADVENTVLSKIFAVIEKDLGKKRRLFHVLNDLIRLFVPFVIFLSACTAYFSGILRGLSVLLISCPCAIGIAIPLVESLLLHQFTQKGAIVRNRSALWILAKNPFFLFDKTGTLTEGKFKVILGMENLDIENKKVLKGLCAHSTHPIACALYDSLECQTIEMDECVEIAGRGMLGKYKKDIYTLGSDFFMKEQGIEISPSLTESVFFAKNSELLTPFSLGDKLRQNLPKVEGAVLSGDSSKSVDQLSRLAGYKWGLGGCTPLQKKEEVEKLKKEGRYVVMVGDGINDAPAMSAADIGISVSSGSDLSMEVADIFLTTDRLDCLDSLVKLAKAGRRLIFQNLFWTFFYNLIGLFLASLGLLTPLFSAAAMVLSSLFVTLNSLRLLRVSASWDM